MRILCSILMLFFSGSLWADIPQRIEATYEIQTKGITLAKVKEVFVRDQNRYHIESITKPVGLLALFKPETIVVTSSGEIGDKGLLPTKFTHRRASDTKMNSDSDFDWVNHEIIHSDRSGIRQQKLDDDTQDRLSMMYQFVAIPPRGRLELKFDISNGSMVEKLQYQLNPEQSVTTSFGTMRSYKLSSLPFNIPKRSEIWLAVDHSFVPCKVTFTDDGGRNLLVQVLTGLKIVP